MAAIKIQDKTDCKIAQTEAAVIAMLYMETAN